MDRKDLIRLYLDAETTCEQEQELAASFATTPPSNEEEMAIYKMVQAVRPFELTELPEAGDEYDRIVKPSKVRLFYTWGFSLAGVAAAIVAVVLLAGKPDDPAITPLEIVESLRISSLNLGDVESITAVPSGPNILVTVLLKDGSELPFIMSKDGDTGTLFLASTK